MSTVHELPLISTLAIGLSTAFVCGFIASKLRIPPLVGYVLAGIIIGPYSPGFIADIAIAEQLSEIGIVLLMFGVGLHFSVADFMEVRKIASIGAMVRICIITFIGWGLGVLWGWGGGAGIIFGLCLSVASTVVLLRTFQEHHLMHTITGKIAIGWLIVEDVAMILALILLPAYAAATSETGGDASSLGTELLTAFAKVGLFAAIMVIAGKRVLPWILSAVSRTGSRELFTLAAFCMAMGIAFGATMFFGVSLALGAFFAGMMIKESDLNHEVAARVLPFQDAFAVLFFVAVGMLFNPQILVTSPLQVLTTVLIIIAGKGVLTFYIIKSFGYPTRISMKIAAGLAQIGEFSFILIALGMSLNLMPPDVRDLILAGALISIAVNPMLFHYVRAWCNKLEEPVQSEIDTLAHLAPEERPIRNHILIIGHGRVGSYASDMLDLSDTDLVVVDNNREKIEKLRAHGYHAVAGDATQKDTLIEANIEKASTVLITVPDHFESRRIFEQIRAIKPEVKIFVRSHNDEETTYFQSQNAELTVSAPEEIARRMIASIERL